MIASIRNSLSAVKAGARALGASASNIANARNIAPLERSAVAAASGADRSGDYDESPRNPLYVPLRAENIAEPGGAVRSVLRLVDPPHLPAFAPGHPAAGADGRVARTNVDTAGELMRSRQARALYDANLKALQTEDEMLGTLLDDKA